MGYISIKLLNLLFRRFKFPAPLPPGTSHPNSLPPEDEVHPDLETFHEAESSSEAEAETLHETEALPDTEGLSEAEVHSDALSPGGSAKTGSEGS